MPNHLSVGAEEVYAGVPRVIDAGLREDGSVFARNRVSPAL